MGDLLDCIERAQRQAEALSIRANVREEYRMAQKQEQNLERLESRIDDLQKQIAELREAASDAELKQAPPSFKELGKKKGFICRKPSGEDLSAIRLSDVIDWLEERGLYDYI